MMQMKNQSNSIGTTNQFQQQDQIFDQIISQILDKEGSPQKAQYTHDQLMMMNNSVGNSNGRNPFKLLGLMAEKEKGGMFGRRGAGRGYLLSDNNGEKLSTKERIKRAFLNMLPKGLKSLKNINDKDQHNKYLITKKTEVLKSKIMLNHILGAVLGVGHGWLQFNENRTYEEYQLITVEGVSRHVSDSKSTQIALYRILGMLMSAAMVFSVIKHYQFDLQLKRIKNSGNSYASIWNPDYKKWIVMEIMICCIFIPPGFNGILTFNTNGGTISYSYDMIFTSLILFKGYLAIRIYQHISLWTDYEAKKISNRMGIYTDEIFALKSDIHDFNYIGLLLVVVALLIYIAAFLYGFERNYYNQYLLTPAWYEFFRFYLNVLWLQVETVFRVGYGDGFPGTLPGRTIMVVTCLGGQYLTSILVGILFQWSKFRPQEASAYQILLSKCHKWDSKVTAKNVIVQALRLKKYLREEYKNKYAFEYQKRRFFANINEFQLNVHKYQYQVFSPNRFLIRMRRKLTKKINQTKVLCNQVPTLTDKMQKLRQRNKDCDSKMKGLVQMQESVMEFFIHQNNIIMKNNLKQQFQQTRSKQDEILEEIENIYR
eukprot:403358978